MMTKTEDFGVEAAMALLLILINIPLSVIALTLLWNWFAVPVGMSPMTWANALGAQLLIGMWKYRWKPTEKHTHAQSLEAAFSWLLIYAFGLGGGWIIAHLGAR